MVQWNIRIRQNKINFDEVTSWYNNENTANKGFDNFNYPFRFLKKSELLYILMRTQKHS